MAACLNREVFRCEKHPHGTYLRYATGCRCLPCRVEAARYRLECIHRQKAGLGNPYISAAPVVAHLRRLSKSGVGYRAVCDVIGIHQSTLQRMKNGTAKFIRKRTAEKILAVSSSAVRDGARIPATETKRRVEKLLRTDFTPKELAERLGRNRVRIGKRVRAVNAMLIEKLYNQVTAEAA